MSEKAGLSPPRELFYIEQFASHKETRSKVYTKEKYKNGGGVSQLMPNSLKHSRRKPLAENTPGILYSQLF